MLLSSSILNIPYSFGFSTSLTRAQYPLKVAIFLMSFSSNIESPFMIMISSSELIPLIAAAVPFSSHCVL
jgi:hypothetical protein